MRSQFAGGRNIIRAKQAHYRRFTHRRVKFVFKCFDEPCHDVRARHPGMCELLRDRLRIVWQIAVQWPVVGPERSDTLAIVVLVQIVRIVDVLDTFDVGAFSVQRRPQMAENMIK